MAKRRQYKKEFQAKVALEAIKSEKTITQIASNFKIHPNLVSKWKLKALEGLPEIFDKVKSKETREFSEDELLKQIGRLQVELEFLKKNSHHLS